MIGIDTNVLVRYMSQDDVVQAKKATALIEGECSEANPGFIGLIVLVELIWVAESCYAATREDVAKIVRQLLDARQLIVQEAESVWQALRLFDSTKADFADCLIERLARSGGCTKTVTFDKKATKVGMTLLV